MTYFEKNYELWDTQYEYAYSNPWLKHQSFDFSWESWTFSSKVYLIATWKYSTPTQINPALKNFKNLISIYFSDAYEVLSYNDFQLIAQYYSSDSQVKEVLDCINDKNYFINACKIIIYFKTKINKPLSCYPWVFDYIEQSKIRLSQKILDSTEEIWEFIDEYISRVNSKNPNIWTWT